MYDKAKLAEILAACEKATPGPVTIKYDDLGDEFVLWAPIEIIGADKFRIVAYDGGLAPDDEWQVETLEANAKLIAFAFNDAPALARHCGELMEAAEDVIKANDIATNKERSMKTLTAAIDRLKQLLAEGSETK